MTTDDTHEDNPAPISRNDGHYCPNGGQTQRATCGRCNRSWCERCDPGPSALCPYCHGRGYSLAPCNRPPPNEGKPLGSKRRIEALELALRELTYFVTSGRRYETRNPYALAEVRNANQALGLDPYGTRK